MFFFSHSAFFRMIFPLEFATNMLMELLSNSVEVDYQPYAHHAMTRGLTTHYRNAPGSCCLHTSRVN